MQEALRSLFRFGYPHLRRSRPRATASIIGHNLNIAISHRASMHSFETRPTSSKRAEGEGRGEEEGRRRGEKKRGGGEGAGGGGRGREERGRA